ncbi:hypothetical protein G4B88_022127 [Cannabis sativa]|uniref:Reverse transcriptase zinc-binding domain-containing protein n=1 Tax=Cannabis sativa TaxID=3483 RepID=A0A7J6FIM6_CANSA|nr:hypothetical protein G4B88_022127 [Cannabis sativa]
MSVLRPSSQVTVQPILPSCRNFLIHHNSSAAVPSVINSGLHPISISSKLSYKGNPYFDFAFMETIPPEPPSAMIKPIVVEDTTQILRATVIYAGIIDYSPDMEKLIPTEILWPEHILDHFRLYIPVSSLIHAALCPFLHNFIVHFCTNTSLSVFVHRQIPTLVLTMDDLSNTFTANLNLTALETQIHSFTDTPDHPEDDGCEEPSAFLAVKLLTTRHFNSEAFKNRLKQILRPHIANPASLAPPPPYRFHQAPIITEGPFNEPTSAYGVQHLSQPQTTLMGLHTTLPSPHFNLNHSPPTTTIWPSNQHVAAPTNFAPQANSPVPSPNNTAPSNLPPFPTVTVAEQLATSLPRPISTSAEALVATTGAPQHVVPVSQAFSTILADLHPSQPLRFAVGSSANTAPSSSRIRKFKPQRNLFTWTNRQKQPNHTQERLDWCLSNNAWDAIFPDSQLNHGDFFGSDHRPLILTLQYMNGHRNQKPRFIFDKLWMSEPGFEDCLRDAWTQTNPNPHPNPLIGLKERLTTCSSRLTLWKQSLGPPIATQILASLLTPDKQWNHALIHSLFPSDISQAITAIPLHPISTQDTYFWSLTPHGSYTVNSGYHLAHTQLHQNEPSSSDSKFFNDWWKKLWALPLPPKLKHFLWRVCYDILPTSRNLFNRKTLHSPHCSRCHYHDETLEHALFRCPASQKLWNCRNSWIHDGISPSPDQVLREISTYMEQYTTCNKKTPTFSPASDDQCLHNNNCPSTSTFHHRLLVDAAQDSQLLKMGFGMTIHTSSGEVLLNLAKPQNGITTPLIMEAHTLYSAISWCHEHSFYPDSIVSDCSVLVNYICKNESHNLHLNPFAIGIKSLLSFFPNVSLSYIPRGSNLAAHCLAKTALGLEQEALWMSPTVQNALSHVSCTSNSH